MFHFKFAHVVVALIKRKKKKQFCRRKKHIITCLFVTKLYCTSIYSLRDNLISLAQVYFRIKRKNC